MPAQTRDTWKILAPHSFFMQFVCVEFMTFGVEVFFIYQCPKHIMDIDIFKLFTNMHTLINKP